MIPTAANSSTEQKFRLIFILAGILLVTFIAFSPTLRNQFINWDDNHHVFLNPALNRPLGEVVRHYFGPHYIIGNYIPVTMTVFALEFKAAGADAAFFHKVNLFIHLLNVVLVFAFIFKLSGKRWEVAAIVSLFFGIHPMHVESVAWISELKDLLYGFFFLAGMITYHRFASSSGKSWLWLAATGLLFLISVLSKPAALSFPVVLLIIDYYIRRPFTRRIWLEKIPFFLLSLVFGLIAIDAQTKDELMVMSHPFIYRVLFAAHSFLLYLVKLFAPVNLSIFYPYPQDLVALPLSYYLAPAGVALLVYLVWKWRKRSHEAVFSLLFFAATLFLVLQLVPVGYAVMAERYTYLPYIGPLYFLAIGLSDWLSRRHAASLNLLAGSLVAILALACMVATRERCRVWRNGMTMADDLVKKHPEDYIALNNKGYLLFEQGLYQEALPLLQNAVRRKPDFRMAAINLADTWVKLQQTDSALAALDAALRFTPEQYNLNYFKAMLLQDKKKYADAAVAYEKALIVKNDDVGLLLRLSECHYYLGRHDSALANVEMALKTDPANPIALNSKGYLLMLKGEYNEAMRLFEASLRHRPDFPTAQANIEACRRLMSSARGGLQPGQ